MRPSVLAPLRSLILCASVVLWMTFPSALARARADEPGGTGAAPDADLGQKIERVVDEHTASLREAIRDAIEGELDRWRRRQTLTPEVREAIDRTLAGVRSRPAPHGILIDGATRRTLTLRDALDRLAQARVIYVAEQHDNPAHHEVQLKVIQAAFKNNPKLMIGMEMFERPLQEHLDDYTQHRIDEATFLERVDWKKAWGFDYGLYKPILDFAHEYKLKVVALNAPRGLVRKVGKDGLASLSAEERKGIARKIDVENAAHREQFMGALHHHGAPGGHSPDPQNYYEAMCVWDETMAESAANHLRAAKHRGSTMVVLAGAGHISYRFGIPARVTRRLDLPSLTVIPVAVSPEDAASDVEETLIRPPGDVIFLTPPSPPRK